MRSLPQLPRGGPTFAPAPRLLEQAAPALFIGQMQLTQSVIFRLAGFLGTLQAFRNS